MHKRRVSGFVATAVTVLVLATSPAGAIPLSLFQNYVSAGAVVLQVSNPFSTALVSLNYRPGDFSPEEANALNAALLTVLTGVSILNSFSPADLAAAGISPVQALQTLQQIRANPSGPLPVRRFVILDLYRRPSGVAIDMYELFGINDLRYIITLG